MSKPKKEYTVGDLDRATKRGGEHVAEMVLHALRPYYDLDDAEKKLVAMTNERRSAVAALRDICAEHGDNDWPDDLHLGGRDREAPPEVPAGMKRWSKDDPSQEIAAAMGCLILDCHDATPPTLAARAGHRDGEITIDYQAEMRVSELDEDHPEIVRIVLWDALGERATWARRSGRLVLASKAKRYVGEWRLGA